MLGKTVHQRFGVMHSIVLLWTLLICTAAAVRSESDDKIREWLRTVNNQLIQLSADFIQAKWNYETNISPETSKVMLEAGATYDAYERSLAPELLKIDPRGIEDSLVRRQIEQMQRYAINESAWTPEASARER